MSASTGEVHPCGHPYTINSSTYTYIHSRCNHLGLNLLSCSILMCRNTTAPQTESSPNENFSSLKCLFSSPLSWETHNPNNLSLDEDRSYSFFSAWILRENLGGRT
ncbi:hypothetical protein Bca52824_001021 [Brassica carinata]|uniref:Uncharacterized protein n=1 Tax=Brassica carinata TaxID=52824 RepID=A0A8X7WHQ4_BRACI|nr:hypothetical protein Bca52824_001021 [Brassica carinata]